MSVGRIAPGSGSKPYGPGATGRPAGKKTATSKVAFLPHANAGQMPEFMKMASDLMKTHGTNELPPGIRPKDGWNRKGINKNISKGMTGNSYGR